MASEDYIKALKSAKAAYRKAVSAGDYPYLPALDDIIDNSRVRTEEPLGIVSIPLDQIAGTKTAGRRQAFASNFMPLMPESSEFAMKWDGVLRYHLDQGVGDPITAYEYMNQFYVLEGNKRVSVLKYFHADSVEGSVTRIVPYPAESIENKIYYEFMDFYRDAQINYLKFSKPGSFQKLTAAVGKTAGEKWTDDEKMDFRSLYNRFQEIFTARKGEELGITAADGLLFYLSLYPYREVLARTPEEMRQDVDRMWDNLPILSEKSRANVSMVFSPSQEPSEGIFTRFFKLHKVKQLKVAFIHDKPAAVSGWTYMHELGRTSLEQVFGDRIRTEAHFLKDTDTDIAELLEETIAAGNHVIFTPNSIFLPASLKASIEHPEVKILNCSLGQPYRTLRTYYGRLYEAKYLCGMIAGSMTANDKIAYQAPLPNYGSVADINAFAMGARMTNPRAQIYLHWASQTDAEGFHALLEREQISVVSDNDMITPASSDRAYGLYMINDGGMKRLATPIWNWHLRGRDRPDHVGRASPGAFGPDEYRERPDVHGQLQSVWRNAAQAGRQYRRFRRPRTVAGRDHHHGLSGGRRDRFDPGKPGTDPGGQGADRAAGQRDACGDDDRINSRKAGPGRRRFRRQGCGELEDEDSAGGG